MATNACRKFTVFDGMILIAATAVGIALARALYEGGRHIPGGEGPLGVCQASVWLMAAWSLALLYLRLRPPRPSLRRVACEPGTIASLAVAVALIVSAADVLQSAVFDWLVYRGFWVNTRSIFQFHTQQLSEHGTFAVAAAWATLAIGRRWRPEKGWLDRLGIILGIGWLARPTVFWIAFRMPEILSLLR